MDLPMPSTSAPPERRRFQLFATGILVFLLAVVLFGAWVRITGSGAGCGEDWPRCHGQLVPRSPSAKTWIEYGHRLSSGLLGVLVLVLPVWAFRGFPRRHPVRRYAVLTLLLVIVEALIGAGLVLKGLVADNDSVARAGVVGLHLVNTFVLLGCAALCVEHSQRSGRSEFFSSDASVLKVAGTSSDDGRGLGWGWLGALLLLLLVSAAGAVTALGDTLFPVGALETQAVPADHFLLRLRVLHPVLALVAVVVLIALSVRSREIESVRELATQLLWMCGLQACVGLVNIWLGAPGYMQLIHLLLAQGVWLWAVRVHSRVWSRSGKFSSTTGDENQRNG